MTMQRIGLVESIDTTEARDQFEERILEARGDRMKLLELRDRIVDEMGDHKRLLSRAATHAYRFPADSPEDLVALLQDNVRVMGQRTMRVQRELTALVEERRQQAREENEMFLRAFISIAKETLPEDLYERIFRAARDRSKEPR